MLTQWLYGLFYRGKALINMGLLKVVFQLIFTGELIHTVGSSAHTVVVCVLGGGGAALVNTGFLR